MDDKRDDIAPRTATGSAERPAESAESTGQSTQSTAPGESTGRTCVGDAGTRREFLGYTLKLAGGALVFLAGADALAGGEKGEGYDWEAHRWAYLIDSSKCIGCGSCVRACRAENDVPENFFRTWVERYLVGPDGATYVDSPNGGYDGFLPAQPPFHPTKAFFVPKMCNHCKATPCIQVCPVGASYQTKDGVVLVDGKRCIGCGYCVQACPYGSRYINENTHVADKCTWCYHRITKGLKPACVSVCPTGTRQFGDLKAENDPVRKAIEKERVSVLQPHHLTEPQCYYLALDKEVR